MSYLQFWKTETLKTDFFHKFGTNSLGVMAWPNIRLLNIYPTYCDIF